MNVPVLLDISRLLSRAGRPVPTGIDRIELAYAEHLIARAGDRLAFVAMNDAGRIAPVAPGLGRRLVRGLGACWRDEGETDAVRRIAARIRLEGLMPGRPVVPSALRETGRRPVYLLASHQNLHRRRCFERFKAESGAAFVAFVHDLIPIGLPGIRQARPGRAPRGTHRDHLRPGRRRRRQFPRDRAVARAAPRADRAGRARAGRLSRGRVRP